MPNPLQTVGRRAAVTFAVVLALSAMALQVSAGPSQPDVAQSATQQATLAAKPAADQAEPMSERAAAAAARAARALADEDADEPAAAEASGPKQVPGAKPVTEPKLVTPGGQQLITPGIKRRTSAEMTCVAGC